MSVSLPIFIHRSRQRSGFKRAVSRRRVIGKYFLRQVHNRKLWPIEYVRGTVVRVGAECPSWIWGDDHEIVVKLRRALSHRYPVNRIAV